MRTIIAIFLFAASALCQAEPDSVSQFELQFRSDMKHLVLARSIAAPTEDKLSESIESLVQQVTRVFPNLFVDDSQATVPTDEILRQLSVELKRVSAGSPTPVLVSYYRDIWESEHMNDSQRVIFGRLMRAVIDHVNKTRDRNEGEPGATDNPGDAQRI